VRARALIRPRALFYIYRRRLRVHAAQEVLAGLGVAIAVALVFAVTVANRSITGSAAQVIHTVLGPANLQLRSRSAEGFDEHLLVRVESLPGVRQAAPILEQPATVIGPHDRRATVTLVGTDISLAVLDGLAHTLPISTLAPGGIALSTTTARELGIGRPSARTAEVPVSLNVRGTVTPLKVGAVLGPEAVGALSQAFLAVMPLANLQALTGLQGRISRVLIETDPGRGATVRRELQEVGRGRITVAPADQDLTLLRQALRPGDQAAEFFAVISGLLGLLFAFNAILLTVPERRQAIADLRVIGTRDTAIVQIVLFQALSLGALASLVGLVVGYGLALGFFHQSPGYLAQAFTLGSGTVVGTLPILVALIGGLLITWLAAMIPLLDLRRGRALDAVYFEDGVPGNMLDERAPRLLGLVAGGLLALATAMFVLLPTLALAAAVVLALATAFAIPLIFSGVLRAARAVSARAPRLTIVPVALTSLRSTTLRSLALAGTGALALFGSVALGGARGDLLRGIERYIGGYVAGAPIWIVNPNDPTAVEPLPSSDVSRVASVPGVASVRVFQNSYLNLGDRRVWILARPPGTSGEVLRGQIVGGSGAAAAARIDEGGWITVSKQIASERKAGDGDTLTLPAPTGGVGFKIAGTTTNLTWSPGAIVMSSADYARAWASASPTSLGVDLVPGAHVLTVLRAIKGALGPMSGVEALTPAAREARTIAYGREGLSKLGEITTLLLIAAVLAIAAALSSAIWQRRAALASLRLSGVAPGRLRRILFMEVVLMLAAPCLTGALAGVYGQVILDGYLRRVTGFPVVALAGAWRPVEFIAIVSLAVLLIASVPAWFASRVSPALALSEG
jgi:putative ABC transport system permease protein